MCHNCNVYFHYETFSFRHLPHIHRILLDSSAVTNWFDESDKLQMRLLAICLSNCALHADVGTTAVSSAKGCSLKKDPPDCWTVVCLCCP